MAKYRLQPIEGDHKERGVFSSKAWRTEALIHYESSVELRRLAASLNQDIDSALRNKQDLNVEVISLHKRLQGLAKSSLLLIGYALELALKSGVAALFRGLPRKHLLEMSPTE